MTNIKPLKLKIDIRLLFAWLVAFSFIACIALARAV